MTQATKLRLIVIERLGSKCAKCGETDIGTLELDHINNDGAQQRKEKSHYRILKELASGIGLERFQLLCANCHRKKMSEYNALFLKRNSYIALKTKEKLEEIIKAKEEKKRIKETGEKILEAVINLEQGIPIDFECGLKSPKARLKEYQAYLAIQELHNDTSVN